MVSPSKRPRLLDQVRDEIRRRHYSIRTEQSYVEWIRRFILFHGKRHPSTMGRDEVEQFLTYLAVERHVSASTQNQAFSALLFLYREVLEIALPSVEDVVRAKRPTRVPVVLTRQEVAQILAHLQGVHYDLAGLMYGSGLRLMEAVRLRVQDVDFGYRQVTVRNGKGQKDRVTPMAESMVENLRARIRTTLTLHDQDCAAGYGAVYLPNALAVKYLSAPTQPGWQYVFPAPRLSRDPRSDRIGRHHIGAQPVQRAVKRAVLKSGVSKNRSAQREERAAAG